MPNQNLRSAPPRYVSILTKIELLYGGFHIQFGSFFFWFGLIVALIFVGNSDARYILSFDGDWIQHEGVVLGSKETNTSVNEERIYEYSFSYSIDGKEFRGTSYGYYDSEWSEQGKTVPIEYKFGNLERSRIYGQDTSSVPLFAVFVLIFPGAGLVFMFVGLRKNLKGLRLLVHGEFTRGQMASYCATSTSINERTVYEYEFIFLVNEHPYTATCKTHLTEEVEDEEKEVILYMPKNPNENVVYDAIASMPIIGVDGTLEQASSLALLSLWSVFLGLLVNGTIAYFMFWA